MEIIEAPAFTRQVTRYLGEEEYRVLQIELAGNPTLGDLMPGTGGFRKLRWADTRRGKGRRGGLRIIYYFFPDARQIWLMTLFGKNEAADLTPQGEKSDESGYRSRTPRAPPRPSQETTEKSSMKKRHAFRELMEGVGAMKRHRSGKLTLRNYDVQPAPLPKVDGRLIRDTRRKLRCSRAVFARKLRINLRTLEKWEQGRARPNPQAAALVLLVRRFPDTLDRLDRVAS